MMKKMTKVKKISVQDRALQGCNPSGTNMDGKTLVGFPHRASPSG